MIKEPYISSKFCTDFEECCTHQQHVEDNLPAEDVNDEVEYLQ